LSSWTTKPYNLGEGTTATYSKFFEEARTIDGPPMSMFSII